MIRDNLDASLTGIGFTVGCRPERAPLPIAAIDGYNALQGR